MEFYFTRKDLTLHHFVITVILECSFGFYRVMSISSNTSISVIVIPLCSLLS